MGTRLESPIQSFDITVDGKPESFNMTLNYFALSKLCELMEVEFDKLDLENIPPSKFPAMIYAAIWSLDHEKTQADADRFLTHIRITDVPTVIRALISSASPDAPPGGADTRPQKAKKR